jgi:hypothetical protein
MLMKVAGVWRRRLDMTDLDEEDSACFTAAEHAKCNTFLERYESDGETRTRVRFVGHTAQRRGVKGEDG